MPDRCHYPYLPITCLAAILLALFAGSQAVYAHGGVIMDSGYTGYVEWLVSIDPYPVTTGEAMITLLVYDVTNYDPLNDLQATLYARGPGKVPPNVGVDLLIDPAIYPGDYSAKILLDQAGEWQLRFVVAGGEKSFEVTVLVQVAAAALGQAPMADSTPNPAATATVFAQNVQLARQQNSPLAMPISPLAFNRPLSDTPSIIDTFVSVNFLGIPWWMWSVAIVIPLIIGWRLLRSPIPMDIDEVGDEIDNEIDPKDDNRSANDEQLSTNAAVKASDT